MRVRVMPTWTCVHMHVLACVQRQPRHFSPRKTPRLGSGPFPPGLPGFSLEGKSHLWVFLKQNEILPFLEHLWKRLSPFYFLF